MLIKSSPVDRPVAISTAAPMFATEHAIGLIAALLALNSLLAALGSVLFAHFPYWPAFMVWALATAIRPVWGFALFLLFPIPSNLLGIGGSQSLAYLPVDALQATLVVLALRFIRIEWELRKPGDALRYLICVAVLPIAAGGVLGWLITSRMNAGGASLAPTNYILWWTLENSLLMLFPGIWLHRSVGRMGGGAPSLRNFQPPLAGNSTALDRALADKLGSRRRHGGGVAGARDFRR